MDSLKDLLGKKAEDIDIASIRDDNAVIQDELNRHFSGTKVHSVKDGVVLVTTSSSSVASDLRLQQYSITQNLNTILKTKIERIRVRIQ